MRRTVLATLVVLATLGTGIANAQKGTIDADSRAALLAALDDERMAEAKYRATIREFGQVKPYINIVRAEVNHQEAVLNLLTKYNIKPPANPWTKAHFDIPDVFTDAAAADAAFEREYAAVLINWSMTLKNQDVARLFAKLADINLNVHAVAFDQAANGLPCYPYGPCSGLCGGACSQNGFMNQVQNRNGMREFGNGKGEGVCDGTGPKGAQNQNGKKQFGNGKGDGVCDGTGPKGAQNQNGKKQLGNGKGDGVCDGTGPKGAQNQNGKKQLGNGKGDGVCDGTGPKGKKNGKG